MIRVILIFGGKSEEHEVSLKSAQSVFKGFDKNKYIVFPVAIAKSGKWYGPISENDIATFLEDNYLDKEIIPLPKPGNLIYNLKDFSIAFKGDIVFPLIHGSNGEDGTLQGILEYMEIPYVGSGVCGSAAGMDKLIMKDIFKAHSIPQVKYVGTTSQEIYTDKEKVVKSIVRNLKYPLFVKPANLGSSVGISKVKNDQELIEALNIASSYDRRVIIEEGKNVREIEVSALGNHNIKLSSFGEVIPGSEFYDYEAKYIKDTSVTKLADDLSQKTIAELIRLSEIAFKALDLSGFTRIDFFIDKETEEILLNEVNTLPGFTSISMYPKLWQYEGIELKELLNELINLGFERYNEKKKYKKDLI